MAMITVKLQTAVRRTFRVEQVAGMFDVPLQQRVRHELTAEVPSLDEQWAIGAIVGPSGSGKTTLARAAFGDCIYRPPKWPRDRALIDCFGDMPVKLLTQALAAVGLGSPVAWVKPYRVLSTGEKFRADLFRSFLTVKKVVVFDEYSGALDRTVAKTASAAFSFFLRAQLEAERRLRFVAVTCHHDVLPWLQPDWVVELGRGTAGQASSGTLRQSRGALQRASSGTLRRGRPRKPAFRLRVDRVPQMLWWNFEPHHYLAGGLAASASCYAAMWGGAKTVKRANENGRQEVSRHSKHGRQECLPHGEPIAFCAVVACLGWKQTKRIQRLVVLPEFQGMGIGGKLLDIVAADQAARGFRVTITASHPAVLAHCGRSERWRYLEIKKLGSTPQVMDGREITSSVGRAVAAFEFVGRGRSD